MNKMAKGAIATGLGVALLIGGGGTLAIWNDTPKGRNPLNIAVLDAELNMLWKTVRDKLEGTPPQWFCYPAILALNEKEFLISYCAGVMPGVGLEKTRIVKVRLEEK